MAEGRARQKRQENIELANLVWSLGEIDTEAYLYYGLLEDNGIGGEVELSPEMEAKVQARIKQIRDEDPTAPKLQTVK